MKIAGYRCDFCDSDDLFENHLAYEPWSVTLPFHWYIVHAGKEKGENPWTFCSQACLKSFMFEESEEDVHQTRKDIGRTREHDRNSI